MVGKTSNMTNEGMTNPLRSDSLAALSYATYLTVTYAVQKLDIVSP